MSCENVVMHDGTAHMSLCWIVVGYVSCACIFISFKTIFIYVTGRTQICCMQSKRTWGFFTCYVNEQFSVTWPWTCCLSEPYDWPLLITFLAVRAALLYIGCSWLAKSLYCLYNILCIWMAYFMLKLLNSASECKDCGLSEPCEWPLLITYLAVRVALLYIGCSCQMSFAETRKVE